MGNGISSVSTSEYFKDYNYMIEGGFKDFDNGSDGPGHDAGGIPGACDKVGGINLPMFNPTNSPFTSSKGGTSNGKSSSKGASTEGSKGGDHGQYRDDAKVGEHYTNANQAAVSVSRDAVGVAIDGPMSGPQAVLTAKDAGECIKEGTQGYIESSKPAAPKSE